MAAGMWTCSLSSLALLALILTVALHVRLGLGQWPNAKTGDYHSALFEIHFGLLNFAEGFALIISLPVWFGLLLASNPSKRIALLQLALYFAGWILIVVAAHCDPTSFTDWLLD